METLWKQIQDYIHEQFHIEPNIHNIIFLIGVQEMGYGFEELNQETKTKVINFASMYIRKYLSEDEKIQIQRCNYSNEIKQVRLYKTAIINYFKSKKILTYDR